VIQRTSTSTSANLRDSEDVYCSDAENVDSDTEDVNRSDSEDQSINDLNPRNNSSHLDM